MTKNVDPRGRWRDRTGRKTVLRNLRSSRARGQLANARGPNRRRGRSVDAAGGGR